MSRRRMLAGNWKMHGSIAQVGSFMADLGTATVPASIDVLVCPPFVHVPAMVAAAASTGVAVGAQNVCAVADPGAHTGEVSAAMLADVGASHVIVGHSERRHIYGESDAIVATKLDNVLQAGLTPILCVGETLEEREADAMQTVLQRQLNAVMTACGVQAFETALIAYEPVWAIGTGRSATPQQAQAAHAFLRAQISAESVTIADRLRILYGGSVKPDNAADLFVGADVDGALVGGASLKADAFLAIGRA